MTATDTTATRPISESELRGLLGQVERRRDGVRLLLVAAEARWDGPAVIESPIGSVRVVVGPSPLAVRIAMVEHPDDILAIITPLSVGELGSEVAARAWRGHPVRPSPWDAVTSLFRVQQIDPSLRPHKWMLDLLVRFAPSTGYPQPASQVLDRDTAWRTLYRHGLHLPDGPITTGQLLQWAAGAEAATSVARLDKDARHNVGAQLAREIGPAAEPLLEMVAAGKTADLVALGIVLDALWPAPDPVARALLQERYLDRRAISDHAATDWGAAAVAIVRDALDHAHRAGVVQRAEQIIAEIDPDGTADSTVLEGSLLRRLARFGEALAAAFDDHAPDALAQAQTALEQAKAHDLASSQPERLEAAEAAFRLTRRWFTERAEDLKDLDQLTAGYIADGGWVDACRHRLAEGETVQALVEVYERISARVDEERRTRDRMFAKAVSSEATAAAPTPSLESVRPLRIEQVLETVLAPLAEQRPVLLLVVDGLSHAASVPMIEDLLAAGWKPQGPAGRPLSGVVATLPTVTICSRASLLAGRLTAGGQDVEREGFESHDRLVEAGGGQRPRLFHKSDLRVSESEVAPEPRELIADAEQRVVGVVVNGVDDFLGAGGQVRLAAGLDGVPLMRQLLGAALEGGRTIVLTSDHGHILGSGQRVIAPNGGGERFRLVGDQGPADDEVLLEGPRVLRGDGRIVAAADDGVRYIGVAKYGYHGGATPAEVLCPLFVLTSQQTELEGWQPIGRHVPTWWDPARPDVELELDVGVVPEAPVAATPAAEEPQLSLLEPTTTPSVAAAPAASRPAWLDQLLASPRLEDQRQLAGRVSLEEADLALLLRVLVASGGTASGAALQRTLDVPSSRLRGKLEAARTLLDVDGYPVLRIEADGTAALNIDLLVQQFEIDRPSTQGST